MTPPTRTTNPSQKKPIWQQGQFWVLLIVLFKLVVHLTTNTLYGFHRDELLYFSLGHQPAWGYWSVPPFIGWLSVGLQATLGDSVFVFRLMATLAGCGIILLSGSIARLLGGGAWAQGMVALGIALAPVYLRTSMLFQPVVFDVFFWTLAFYWLIRYIREEKDGLLFALGATLALAFLNKYLIVFWLMAFLVASIFTPQRKLYVKKATWAAALLALLLILPNLLWQIKYNFPVLTHMRLLRAYQLVNVAPKDFLIEQLLITLMGGLLWLPGLWWVLVKEKRFRLIGFIYLGVLLLLLIFQGKSYYTAGLYPVLMAAGAVAWEQWLTKKWIRVLWPVLFMLNTWPMIPFGVTVLKPEKMVRYGEWVSENMGLSMLLRWEDGVVRALPQDYADMLGWEEIGHLVIEAWEEAPEDSVPLVYCENYGQAGAVLRYASPQGVPVPVSFSDVFAIWAPETTEANTLIYVNDELGEDIQQAFAKITLIGQVNHPHARERGTQVYLCESPVAEFGQLWTQRLQEVKAELGMPE